MGWFSKKSVPSGARPPVWLGEASTGFARSYEAQVEEVYRTNPVGFRAVRMIGQALGGIWSLSYELLGMFCPEEWKQRDLDGNAAQTGWDPPSTLLSPASQGAMAYLRNIARELVGLSLEAGLTPSFQVGEPWWWTSLDGRIFMYDDAATALLGATPVADVGASLDDAQKARMDAAGSVLAQSTAALAAVREEAPETVSHLLAYLPTVLDPKWPELRRANLPLRWAMPAFHRLQIEDYDCSCRATIGRSWASARSTSPSPKSAMVVDRSRPSGSSQTRRMKWTGRIVSGSRY